MWRREAWHHTHTRAHTYTRTCTHILIEASSISQVICKPTHFFSFLVIPSRFQAPKFLSGNCSTSRTSHFHPICLLPVRSPCGQSVIFIRSCHTPVKSFSDFSFPSRPEPFMWPNRWGRTSLIWPLPPLHFRLRSLPPTLCSGQGTFV